MPARLARELKPPPPLLDGVLLRQAETDHEAHDGGDAAPFQDQLPLLEELAKQLHDVDLVVFFLHVLGLGIVFLFHVYFFNELIRLTTTMAREAVEELRDTISPALMLLRSGLVGTMISQPGSICRLPSFFTAELPFM